MEKFPILDDHFHITRRTGVGPSVVKEFMRSGGTHIVLVSLPSWSCGVTPHTPADYCQVFDELLTVSAMVNELGCVCYPVAGVHPAEIGLLSERLGLSAAEELICGGAGCRRRVCPRGHMYRPEVRQAALSGDP